MRTKLEAELRHYKEADTQREGKPFAISEHLMIPYCSVNLHSIRRNVSFKAAKPVSLDNYSHICLHKEPSLSTIMIIILV